MKHFFALDETGSFDMSVDDNSFVCGVSISHNELELKEKYKESYVSFGFGNVAPNNKDDLIGGEQFHYCGLSQRNKETCKNIFLPLADSIYVSRGKPALYANNQNWWLVAVTVVITKYLTTYALNKGDEVHILIDSRKDIVFGLPYDDYIKKLLASESDERYRRYKSYHVDLAKQIKSYVHHMEEERDIKIEICFSNDTSSFFINVADIICGILGKGSNVVNKKIVGCSCSKFTSGGDPALYVEENPLMAMTLVFQQASNHIFTSIGIVKKILERLRKNSDSYLLVWDMFYDLMKFEVSERSFHGYLLNVKSLVNVFIKEYNNVGCKLVPLNKRIELIVLFVEYFSHIGEVKIESPFKRSDVVAMFSESGTVSETRLLRKWEKYISFSLREAQIKFNAYDFDSAVKDLNDLWACQEKITNDIPKIFGNADVNKDEPTAAIIGTLAQSYAYVDNFDKAKEDFEYSKDYAIKTTSKTASYLFTIYHRQRDIANARECFKEQSGTSAEDYGKICDFKNVWILLSYCKLRTLELCVNNSTKLSAVDLTKLGSYNSEYPFPLIQKWEGIAKWIENSSLNKVIVENYFSDAIDNLLKEDNGFVIKTLALPIIQCYALVNNQNKFHAKYNFILDDLKNKSLFFKKYVDNRAVSLNSLKNGEDIWNRAMLLPFIYA